MWLLSNIKLIGIAAALLASFGAGIYVHSQFAERKLAIALEAQKEALVQQCKEDKAITNDVARDYETQLNNLNKRLGALKRLRTACIVPTTNTTGSNNGGATGKLSGQNGVTAESLFDYAGDAEQTRLKLLACRDFINKTWSAKGQ